MRRVKEDAEVIVRLDYQDQKAHITVAAWLAAHRNACTLCMASPGQDSAASTAAAKNQKGCFKTRNWSKAEEKTR